MYDSLTLTEHLLVMWYDIIRGVPGLLQRLSTCQMGIAMELTAALRW
jgi:hypothetical protein